MKYLFILLLAGCTSTQEQTSEMPIVNICILASCSVQSSERGAAQDNLEDSDLDANLNDNTNQKSTNENEVKIK